MDINQVVTDYALKAVFAILSGIIVFMWKINGRTASIETRVAGLETQMFAISAELRNVTIGLARLEGGQRVKDTSDKTPPSS